MQTLGMSAGTGSFCAGRIFQRMGPMGLDVNTLFLVTIYVEAMLGLLLLFAWIQNSGIHAVAWWGCAHLLRAGSWFSLVGSTSWWQASTFSFIRIDSLVSFSIADLSAAISALAAARSRSDAAILRVWVSRDSFDSGR